MHDPTDWSAFYGLVIALRACFSVHVLFVMCDATFYCVLVAWYPLLFTFIHFQSITS